MKGVIRGHAPNQTYWIDGKQVTRAEFKKAFPDQPLRGGAGLVGWKDLHSEALAVHPDLINEAVRDAQAKGVPTHFDPEGRPVFTSRGHRREYMKRYGFYDRDGGYGDAQKGETDAQTRDKGPGPDYDLGAPPPVRHSEAFSEEQKRNLDEAMRRLRR